MNNNEIAPKKREKYLAFEYFVLSLYRWNQELDNFCKPVYTKLQLQKLLFFASAINADAQHHEMLDMFNRFYALPYGPVELDIYEAMNTGTIGNIRINDRVCKIESVDSEKFDNLKLSCKKVIDKSVEALKSLNVNYFSMSPFQLVEISHCWTVWKEAYSFATLCGSKQEPMDSKAIYTSEVKYFGA